MSSESSGFFLFAAVFIATAALLMLGGGEVSSNWWRSELVRRGHAEYNPKTGVWQWKGESMQVLGGK